MKDRLRTSAAQERLLPRAALAAFFGGALLLTGCSSSDEAAAAESGAEPARVVTTTTINGISYREDGSRAYDLPPPRNNDKGGSQILVVDRCKPGMDIIETTHFFTYDGSVTGGNSVLAGNGACVDGRLTPEDFPTPIRKLPSL